MSKLKDIIENSKNIVFFGGAGVSTESGIPDFRSTDGLYNQQYKFPPEVILSYTFFVNHTKEFYKFYKAKMLCLDIKPNNAHRALAKLEKDKKVKAIVTQNIDGLHQKAGSENIYELHGSIHRNYCTKCGKFFTAEYIANFLDPIPLCDECNGIIKPDVVLYEEGLNRNTINGAVDSIRKADTLIIAGTSLTVYPASGLINYFNGNNLILINRDKTSIDTKASLVIYDNVGKVLSEFL